jgi:hypothetical protein
MAKDDRVDDSDYKKSMERVEQMLNELAEASWSKFVEYRTQTQGKHFAYPVPRAETALEKAKAMLSDTGFLDGPEKWRMDTLVAINERIFYHGTSFLDKLSPLISSEEKAFYANMLIHEARTQPPKQMGYKWLVEQYDNGKLRDFIDHDLLVESVNRGFWELVSEYLSNSAHGRLMAVVPWKSYETLMKYSEHLDFTKYRECWPEKLRSRDGWPGKDYAKVYDRAKASGALSTKELGFLASPMVDRIIDVALNPYEVEVDPEPFMEANMKRFTDVLGTPAIQNLLKESFSLCINLLSDEEDNIYNAKVIEPYLRMADSAKRNLASSSLDRKELWLIGNMINGRFPAEWLNEEAKEYVQSKIVKVIDGNHGKISLLPKNIDYITDAMKSGLLGKKLGIEKMERELTFYTEAKKRPGGKVAQEMYSMKLEGINPELVKQVRGVAMKDMLLRRVTTDVAETGDESWVQRGKPDHDRGTAGVQLSFTGLEMSKGAEQQGGKSRSKA